MTIYDDMESGVYAKVPQMKDHPITDRRIVIPSYLMRVLCNSVMRILEDCWDFDSMKVITMETHYYVEIYVHKYSYEELKRIVDMDNMINDRFEGIFRCVDKNDCPRYVIRVRYA